jgi:hypothetical protein
MLTLRGTMGSSARLLTLVPLMAAFLLSAPQVEAQTDGALRERVLREYPGALKALESHFSRAKGIVRRRNVRVKGPPRERPSPDERYVFELRPDMARVVVERQYAAGKTAPTRKDAATCYNRDYTFQLKKEGEESAFFLSSFSWNKGADPEQGARRTHAQIKDYLNAPFTLAYAPISELFAYEGFSVGNVSRVGDGPGERLRVEFDTGPVAKPRTRRRGWFIVSPAEAWVLCSFELTLGPRMIKRGTITYSGTEDGVPLPKQAVYTHEVLAGPDQKAPPKKIAPGSQGANNGDSAGTSVETYDFDELTLASMPDADFTLTAFGLPEVGAAARRAPGNLTLWMFGLACAAMAAAVALRAAAARLRRRDALAEG